MTQLASPDQSQIIINKSKKNNWLQRYHLTLS